MSDERDGAGSASDDTETADDTEGRGRTAVAAPRSMQPRGKRSRRDATDSEDADSTATELGVSKNGTGKKKKAAKGDASRNPIIFVLTYLKQVVAELRKVIWPNRKQMVTYTTVVLIFLAFMVALIGGVDYGLAKLVALVFGE